MRSRTPCWLAWCRNGCCSGRPGPPMTVNRVFPGRPALMGREDVPEREQAGHRVTESVERGPSGVGFAAPLDAFTARPTSPPSPGSGSRPMRPRPEREQVVPGGRQGGRPFRPGGQPHRLHPLNAGTAQRLCGTAGRSSPRPGPLPSGQACPARLSITLGALWMPGVSDALPHVGVVVNRSPVRAAKATVAEC